MHRLTVAIRLLPLALALLLPPLTRAAAADGGSFRFRGTYFPTSVEVAGESLPVRGAHRVKYLFWDVYSAALYAPADTAVDADALLDPNVPRQLILHYHRTIDVRHIIKATRVGMERNPAVDLPTLEDRLRRVYACYRTVREGDEYRIVHEPGVGVRIFLNDAEQCMIEGEDFARAFFGLWISNHALDSDMARDLRAPLSER